MTLKQYSELLFQIEVLNDFFSPICLVVSKSHKDDEIVANLSFKNNLSVIIISSDNINDIMNALSHCTKVMRAVESFNKTYGSLLLDKSKDKTENKYEDIHRNSDDWWDQS